MNRSEEINEIAAALAKAQGEMGQANKDAENPFFKSNYATLAALKAACTSHLTKHGLSVSQLVGPMGEGHYLETRLMHSSGQWLSSFDPILTKDGSPQAYGSGKKYAMRYGYEATVGIATIDSDDDGNKAQGPIVEFKSTSQYAPKKPAAFVPKPAAKRPTDPIPPPSDEDFTF